jgi:glycosyltransferase involved in cell wall biosynthesis
MQNWKISVIVPAFNEERSIEKCLYETCESLNHSGMDYQIVVVDDGSRDKTFEIVQNIAKDRSFIKMIKHETNMGRCAAIKTGLSHASGNILCFLDADLEYDPAEIPKITKPIVLGKADAVYGSRFLKGRPKKMDFFHRFGNKAITTTANFLFGKRLTDVMTGSKIFRKDTLRAISISSERFELEVEIVSKLSRNGAKVVEIPITYERRKTGRSKISWIDGIKCLARLFMYRLM